MGFLVVDQFARKYGIALDIKKKKAVFGRGKCSTEDVVLLKPQTFMNLSGEAVLYLASFLKVMTSNVIVIADDTELPFGKIRIRRGGGSGGHNGIKSLIHSLKSEDFPRLRFGIGRPESDSEQDLCEYVLEDFTPEEFETFKKKSDRIVEALTVMICESVEEAMNRFNG